MTDSTDNIDSGSGFCLCERCRDDRANMIIRMLRTAIDSVTSELRDEGDGSFDLDDITRLTAALHFEFALLLCDLLHEIKPDNATAEDVAGMVIKVCTHLDGQILATLSHGHESTYAKIDRMLTEAPSIGEVLH